MSRVLAKSEAPIESGSAKGVQVPGDVPIAAVVAKPVRGSSCRAKANSAQGLCCLQLKIREAQSDRGRAFGLNTIEDFQRAPKQRSRSLLLVSSLLLLHLILLHCSTRATGALGQKQASGGVTNAYGEPIKWSFGGWAPLDGGPAARNASAGRAETQAGTKTRPTSPMPNLSSPSGRPTTLRPAHSGRQQQQQAENNLTLAQPTANERKAQAETMNELASNSHDRVQFAAPNQQQEHPAAGQLQQSRTQQALLHTGPAYALPLQRPPQFSPPAPPPIVRDHLLPAANHNQASHSSPQRPPSHHQANYHLQQHLMMQQQQRQHQMRQPYSQHQGLAMRRPQDNFFLQQQQQRMRHHYQQQQMMQQQQQAMMQQQQAHPQRHQQQQQQQQRQQYVQRQHHHQPHHYQPMTELAPPTRSIPNYPGSPPSIQQHHRPETPQVGAYKLVEGEQPIVFTSSLPNERIPMIEVSATPNENQNSANRSESHHGQQEAAAAALDKQAGGQQTSTTSADRIHPSTLAAIEKDNLNYANALNKVANYLAAEQQQQQSNNIQDIKQKQHQQYEEETPNEKAARGDKPTAASPSYLTIPVAVETEGDKVLTSEDINEIEKHVINVLPNLKTAEKIVKLADAHLTLASLKAHEGGEESAGPDLHRHNYEEHRSTMKQLEGDLREQSDYSGASHQQRQQQQQPQQADQAPTTPASAGYQSSAAAPMNQATSPNVQHTDEPSAQQLLAEQQYFVASGPLQEVGHLDQEQMADYNLIKNDLLANFRYEPTRAQQGGSTPPMASYVTSGARQAPQVRQPALEGQHKQRRPGMASVTRYFQQGKAGGHARPSQAARLNGQGGQEYGSSTTRALLGGRKVSEVMRPLIHTTPVPMTSPIHVPSVEPEKVDAIQLIAGQANDRRPMVVEAHQLVNHTPDGGIDYNSGAPMVQQQPETNQNESFIRQPANQFGAPIVQQEQQGEGQGAIIEYVAISDQALSNAVARQHQQQMEAQNNQAYELAGQPQLQPIYMSAEQQQGDQVRQQLGGEGQTSGQPTFLYDYSMSTQHQSSFSHADQAQEAPTTSAQMAPSNNAAQREQQHQPEAQLSLAWSPSVASEHQQQQMELSELAPPLQTLGMPATAGYNFFGHQQQAQTNQPQEYEQQQQQQQRQANQRPGWRTKAGGSQPNPDAQYDGQIVKDAPQQEQDQDNSREREQVDENPPRQLNQQFPNYENQPQHQHPTVDLVRIAPVSNSRPQEEQERREQQQHAQQRQQHHEQQPQVALDDNNNVDSYRQQEQARPEQQREQYQDQTTTQTNQEQSDNYLSTNSYVAGAQLNHQMPAHGSFSNQNQAQLQNSQTQPPTVGPYTYMKLDRERQQNHLVEHQAQHQAQLADLISSQQPYQTTTPMTMTTLAAIEQQENSEQQRQQVEQQQEQQQQQQQQQQHQQMQQGTGYVIEQGQSQPSVQSPPDSMLVNESPIQVPISDQQSLLADPNQESNEQFSEDDGAKQRQRPQPAGVYQVYQAYYAPKDHKPLPGYVRLSLEEFNELFRDAEIQYVDRNVNGLVQPGLLSPMGGQHQGESVNPYEQPSQAGEMMKVSASESQSILVDGRSISERRSSNSSSLSSESKIKPDRMLKLGQAVKKIISIRNSRQFAKQTKASRLATRKITAQTSAPNLEVATTSATLSITSSPESTPKKVELEGSKHALVLKKRTEVLPKKTAQERKANKEKML